MKVRQIATLCEYGGMTNELARDKFIFVLMDQDSRQELLKTERKPDGTKKTLADVV